MKKLFKLLSLGLLITLAGCSTDGGSSSELSSEEPPVSSEPAPQEKDGTIIKKIADDLFDYGGANRENVTYSRIKRSLDTLSPVDESHRGPEIKIPAVLLYLTGVIGEIDNVDVVNKAFDFTGVYEFDYGGGTEPNWHEQTIGLTINAKLDKDNNKVLFSGIEKVIVDDVVMANDYIFIDLSYNFETKTLGDFKMYQQHPTEIYYFQSIGGVSSKTDSSTSTEDRAVIEAKYNEYVAAFNTLCGSSETKVVASGDLLTASTEAFVKTQKYANKLYGQPVDSVRIKESA